MSDALSCFVRNDGAPILSMAAMIIAALINCICDYVFIFIFHLGTGGVAIATGIGTTVGMIILLMHFILKRGKLRFVRTKFFIKDIKRIFKNGFPKLHYVGD